MKKFAIKLIWFTCILCSVFLIVIILNRTFSNVIINKHKHILVVGHSHSECAFNNSLITDLKNYSRSGEAYFYTYSKVKLLLNQNPSIDYVFIEYSNNSIDNHINNWIWGDEYMTHNFPKFASFMDFNSILFLAKKNPTCFKECIIPWLKNDFEMLTKGFNYDKDLGGYLYLVRDKTDSLIAAIPTNNDSLKNIYQLSTTNIEYLQKTISYCEQKKVKVYLIRSPLHKLYSEYQNEILFQNTLKDEFSKVEFLDFSKFPLSNSEFGDLEHLNFKGAKIFSIWFSNLLKNGLLKRVDKQKYINKMMQFQTQKTKS